MGKAGITAVRRLRKSDNLRVARACGATIVNRTDEITEDDIGTKCGLFEVRKIGDEYFTFLEQCKDPKACTILLSGASKDILNEVERNLQDALNVARNLYQDPFIVPGGGATEMEIAHQLGLKAKTLNGVIQWPYKAVTSALEIIPRTLAQNCGANTIRTITALRAKHAHEQEKNVNWGINGQTGEILTWPLLVSGNLWLSSSRCTRQPWRPPSYSSGLTTLCQDPRRRIPEMEVQPSSTVELLREWRCNFIQKCTSSLILSLYSLYVTLTIN